MLPAKWQNAAVKKSAFGRAIDRFKTESRKRGRTARIGFLIDATSSRAETWREAQTIQAGMFGSVSRLRKLELRLVHFGGGRLTDHGWMTSPDAVAAAMARVECIAGKTQILPGLRVFLDEGDRPDAVILIGDCFEEDRQRIPAVALELASAGVKVFSFLEGDDWTAMNAFFSLALRTGGKFAWFGEDLPLGDLCEGVALLTAGGDGAIRRIKNPKVRQLLLPGPSGT